VTRENGDGVKIEDEKGEEEEETLGLAIPLLLNPD
jgi:hypothetical protein